MLCEEPYEVGRFVRIPGRYVVCLHVSLSSEALGQVGVLEEVTDVLDELNVPIVFIKMSRLKPGARGRASIFVDLTGRADVMGSLIERIKSVRFVEDVRVIEPIVEGFTIDNTPPFLTFLGERIVMFMRPYYEAMIKSLREKMGSGYKALLYHIGFEMGLFSYKIVREMARKLEDVILLQQEMFKHMGFGALKIELSGRRSVAKVWNSFECELFKGSSECEGQLVRGMLAGFIGSILNREVLAHEVKCIAKGDPYCEYVVY